MTCAENNSGCYLASEDAGPELHRARHAAPFDPSSFHPVGGLGDLIIED